MLSGVAVKDVSPHEFVKAFGAYLKKIRENEYSRMGELVRNIAGFLVKEDCINFNKNKRI